MGSTCVLRRRVCNPLTDRLSGTYQFMTVARPFVSSLLLSLMQKRPVLPEATRSARRFFSIWLAPDRRRLVAASAQVAVLSAVNRIMPSRPSTVSATYYYIYLSRMAA